MNLTITLSSLLGLALATVAVPAAHAASPANSIKVIRSVGTEGNGNAKASTAWQELAKADAGALISILEGMDGASPIALNWLRSAVDTIAAREIAAGRPLPTARLEKFLSQKKHHPRARRLAFELIAQADPARGESLLAGMLDDPSAELRREAVERVVAAGKKHQDAGHKDQAIASYSTALKAARDADQVESIAKTLTTLGHPVNLAQVFGWLSDWNVIGPFDNAGGAGFERVYPPETGVDLKATLDGKTEKVRWQSLSATNDMGLVDLNKPFGSLKGVTGYAYTEITSAQARPVELRLGCKNGWKIWFNGKYIFGRDEYHRGMEIDQYRFKVDLKPGKNTLLVKVCQNEQKEDWTKEWEFQLRITDDLGTPVDLATR